MTLRALKGASFVLDGDVNFEAPSLNELAKYVTSVSDYCDGLSKGFCLICSLLYSESNWVQLLTPRAIVGADFVCIGGR